MSDPAQTSFDKFWHRLYDKYRFIRYDTASLRLFLTLKNLTRQIFTKTFLARTIWAPNRDWHCWRSISMAAVMNSCTSYYPQAGKYCRTLSKPHSIIFAIACMINIDLYGAIPRVFVFFSPDIISPAKFSPRHFSPRQFRLPTAIGTVGEAFRWLQSRIVLQVIIRRQENILSDTGPGNLNLPDIIPVRI